MFQHAKPIRRLALAAALAGAALPAVASADSIVYVKDGDVWLTEPDGSRQFQVTTGGGHTSVSQSENGVIVAARGNGLVRLSRTGEVLNEITTAIKNGNWNGPYDIDVSPDGTRVAYGFLYQRIFADPTCPFTPSQCASSSVFSGVAYSQTSGPASGVPMHTGWSYPAWVDDSLLLHSEADGVLNKETIVRPFGSANTTGQQWYTHPAIGRMRDATVRGNTLAFVGPESGQVLGVAHFDGAPGSSPTVDDCFAYQQPTGQFRSPTLAPGTRSLAWAEDDGIWRGDFDNTSDGCDGAPGNGRLIVAGGRSPDWGPADVPAPRTEKPKDDSPQGDAPETKPPSREVPKPPVKLGPAPRTAQVTLSVSRARLARALSRGLTVKVAGVERDVRVEAAISAGTAKRARLGRRARTVATGTAPRFRRPGDGDAALLAPGRGPAAQAAFPAAHRPCRRRRCSGLADAQALVARRRPGDRRARRRHATRVVVATLRACLLSSSVVPTLRPGRRAVAGVRDGRHPAARNHPGGPLARHRRGRMQLRVQVRLRIRHPSLQNSRNLT
jgi:hypothetical protein